MYNEFYGLRESPFGLTPDPKYLFPGEAHKEALAHITYGVEERRGFVLVLGEAGTGKTTLIWHVLQSCGPDVKSAFLFNAVLTFEELLQAVLRDLEVPVPSDRRADLIEALNDYLLKEHAAGRRVVVIIDEAQHLSAAIIEDLRMLSKLETTWSKLLQIVLVGQPELGERLGHGTLQQVRQRIGLIAELEPLSRRDTDRYVKHRLAIAGAEGRCVFTRRALRTVHEASRGIPRLINVICDNSLLLGYGANKRRIGGRMVRQAAREWAVFGATLAPSRGRIARSRSPVHRRTGRRSRPAILVAPISAVAVLAIILGAGFHVARTRTPGQPSVGTLPAVGTPGPAGRIAPAGHDEAAPSAPGVPEERRVIHAPREERPAIARAVNEEPPPSQPESTVPSPAPASAKPLTASEVLESSDRTLAVVTVQSRDTLRWLLSAVYGQVNDTVADVVQLANPNIAQMDLVQAGQRLRLPPVAPAVMVHKVAEGRYVVHLLTTSDPADRRVRRLRTDVVAAGRTVRLEPVWLWTGCQACYRMWADEFPSRGEAEAFYRAMRPWNAG